MVEKFEMSKTSLLKGKYVFSLIFQGKTQTGFAASFLVKLFEYGNNYEIASDTFIASNVYDAMLSAYCEGKKILKQNKYDCSIADEVFALFKDKEQRRFKFKKQGEFWK